MRRKESRSMIKIVGKVCFGQLQQAQSTALSWPGPCPQARHSPLRSQLPLEIPLLLCLPLIIAQIEYLPGLVSVMLAFQSACCILCSVLSFLPRELPRLIKCRYWRWPEGEQQTVGFYSSSPLPKYGRY